MACGSARLVAFFLSIHIMQGEVIPPVVEPPSGQAVPNNTTHNVSYSCTVAAELSQLWQVDNLQVTPANIPSFEMRGVFIERDTILVLAEQALSTAGRQYKIQCLAFNPRNLSSSLSDPLFVTVFGPPGPVVNFDVIPFSETSVLVTWDRPLNSPADIPIEYTVTIAQFASLAPVISEMSTSSTSLEVREMGRDCVRHLFTIRARNSAGTGDPVSINESIPISPDLTLTDSSLTLNVNVSSSSAAEVAISFMRATSCSAEFSVSSHTVVVRRRDGGEELHRAQVFSATDLLREVVRDLPRDSALLLEVEACNSLLCRTSRTFDLFTTDVQTVSVLFFETFISINCTFGSGSLARGCVVSLQLTEREGEEMVTEMFWLERETGSSVTMQCNRTQNSRSVYEEITAVDWESDGTLGLQSIPAEVSVTNNTEDFPCSTGGERDSGLSGGEVAGIVVGVVLFVIIVMAVIAITVFFIYHRTRDVKKKPNGAISIEERTLLPRAERHNIRGLSAISPFTSLPASVPVATDSTPPHESGAVTPTSSVPVHRLQSSLDCGPVGEINIPAGKRGKIHMHLWSDTLERCKRTGKTNFQLLPLLEDDSDPHSSDM